MRVEKNKLFTIITSDIVTVATTIVLPDIDAVRPHCFAGVQFFADAAGTTPATPGAGAILIEVQTVNSIQNFEPAPANLIDLTNIKTVTWGANTKCVRAMPTGVTVATHYRLVVTCNGT